MKNFNPEVGGVCYLRNGDKLTIASVGKTIWPTYPLYISFIGGNSLELDIYGNYDNKEKHKWDVVGYEPPKQKSLEVKNKKLLVCGYAEHGKDTFCEMLNIPFQSSSLAAIKTVFNDFKHPHKTPQELYEDRANYRPQLYKAISEYNTPDLTRLARKILSECDIYCGMRRKEEFEASKHLFYMTIWVDASLRKPPESTDSCTITPEMCDIIVNNNGTLNNLRSIVEKIKGIFI